MMAIFVTTIKHGDVWYSKGVLASLGTAAAFMVANLLIMDWQWWLSEMLQGDNGGLPGTVVSDGSRCGQVESLLGCQSL